jgi:hypothetical protein
MANLQKAVERLQSADWSPYADLLPTPTADVAKYEAAAKLIFQTFTSPAGRKTLDWLIGSFAMRMTEPESGTQAAFREGQANVVRQILYQIHIAQEGLKNG